MNKEIEVITYEDDKDNKNINIFFKTLIRISNLSQFALALFGIYIALTIEWSFIKIVLFVIMAFYFSATIFLIYFYSKTLLKKKP